MEEESGIHGSILNLCVDGLPFMALVVSKEKTILNCNMDLVKFLEYNNKSELINKNLIQTLFPPTLKQRAEMMFPIWEKSDKMLNIEFQLMTKTGLSKDVLMNIGNYSFDQHQLSFKLIAIIYNSEYLDIIRSYRRYSEIFENLSEGVIIADSEKNIIDWNKGAEKIYGYTKNEILGKTVDLIQDPNEKESDPDKFNGIFNKILNKEEWRGELNFLRKDGIKGITETTIIPFFDDLRNELVYIGVNRDITDRKLAEKKSEESRQTLENLYFRLIKIQEEERKRVAHEIHDELGQLLTALKINYSNIKDSISTDITGNIHTIIDESTVIINNISDHLHHIIFDLRPTVLDDLGLVAALSLYSSQIRKRTGINIKLNIIGIQSRINPEIEITLYRIVQEAINNIIKHANARSVIINLRHKITNLELEIIDNGIGFDINTKSFETRSDTGYGILGMKERLSFIKGDFKISSKVGEGTKILCIVPLR